MHLFTSNSKSPRVSFDDGRRGFRQRNNLIIRIAPDKCSAIDRKTFKTTDDPDPIFNEKKPEANEKYICGNPECNQTIKVPRKDAETEPVIKCQPHYSLESKCRKKCPQRHVKIQETEPCQLKIEENGDIVCGDENRKCFCDHNKQKTEEFEQSKVPKLCDSIHSLIHDHDTQPIKNYVADKSSAVSLAVKSIIWKQLPPPPTICCVTRKNDENNDTDESQSDKNLNFYPTCSINNDINLSKLNDAKTSADSQIVIMNKMDQNATTEPQTEGLRLSPTCIINNDINLSKLDDAKTSADGQIVTIGKRYPELIRVQSSNNLALNIRIDPINGQTINAARPPDIVVLVKLDDTSSQIKDKFEPTKAHSETAFGRISMDALKQSTDALKSAMGVLKNKLDASKCAITNYIYNEFTNSESCDACKINSESSKKPSLSLLASKISNTVLDTLKTKCGALAPCSLCARYVDRCCSPIHVKVSSAQRNTRGYKACNQSCKVDCEKDNAPTRSNLRNQDYYYRSPPPSSKRRMRPNSSQQEQQSRYASRNQDCCSNLNKEIHHNKIEIKRQEGQSSENLRPRIIHQASFPGNTKLKAESLRKWKTKFVVDEIKKDLFKQTLSIIPKQNHTEHIDTLNENAPDRDQGTVKLRKENSKFTESTANREFSEGEFVKYTYGSKGDKKQTVIAKQGDKSKRRVLRRAHKIINTKEKDLNIKLKKTGSANNTETNGFANTEKKTINIFRKSNFHAVESTSSMALNIYNDLIENSYEADFDKVASRLSKDEEMYLRNQTLSL